MWRVKLPCNREARFLDGQDSSDYYKIITISASDLTDRQRRAFISLFSEAEEGTAYAGYDFYLAGDSHGFLYPNMAGLLKLLDEEAAAEDERRAKRSSAIEDNVQELLGRTAEQIFEEGLAYRLTDDPRLAELRTAVSKLRAVREAEEDERRASYWRECEEQSAKAEAYKKEVEDALKDFASSKGDRFKQCVDGGYGFQQALLDVLDGELSAVLAEHCATAVKLHKAGITLSPDKDYDAAAFPSYSSMKMQEDICRIIDTNPLGIPDILLDDITVSATKVIAVAASGGQLSEERYTFGVVVGIDMEIGECEILCMTPEDGELVIKS